MKNKVLSLILALLMAASSASAVLADEAIADVETTAVEEVVVAGQYDKAIEFLANYGIFKGYSATNTGAEDLIQRYQMALFVSRIATGWVDDAKWEDGPENWSEFSDIDVDPVNNYYGALSFANQKGIIEGYGNGKFGPTDSITYQNALTMVVRTLGYTGLDWPWGYIQKAVELGLTDGITDVAYTQELTRGEVAQIIYNALFAKTKAGNTLAMSSFGIEFGWEKVIITASDLDSFLADEDEESALESNNAYKKFNKSNKTADGFVSFKILNDDGSLGDDTFYMLGSDIGLSKEDNMHDDEAVVGDAYYLLFEKDANEDLVKVIAAESLYTETIWNYGKTDDYGVAQDYAIDAYLKANTLVSKYTTSEYINVTEKKLPEVMVFDKTGSVEEKVVNGSRIAIDWSTGDILVPVEDKNEKDGYKKDKDGNYEYTVAYHYYDLLKNYWTVVVDDDYGVVGYKLMSDADLAKLIDTYKITETKAYKSGFSTAITSIATSAYASLDLFDTNLDGVADRGIYEHYRLGYFTESTVSCGTCGARDSYKISDVSLTNAKNASDVKADGKKDSKGIDVVDGTFNTIVEGVVCSHNGANRAWFVEGYEPTTAYDADGVATGYKAGYVIYSYDAETGAIKVVKNIEDGSDADSYVKTGIVRAYDAKAGTVTIDEKTYTVKYDELEGNGFKYVTANEKTRAQYTGTLRALFNQFVNFVVVDGELVHIAAANAKTDAVIIVDSYAGLDSDGYIVVNGYLSTEGAKYQQFRIGSYDGWEKGDYYYYLDKTTAENSFTKGTIYTIASRDTTNDVYYVNLAGKWDYEDKTYTVNSSDLTTFKDIVIKNEIGSKADNTYVNLAADGYMNVAIGTKNADVKMKDSDTYIIIPEYVADSEYTSLIVYQGILPKGWTVTGKVINTDACDKRTYVIVNATGIVGFNNDNYNAGLVLLLNDTASSIKYNGATSETAYLLGASVFSYDVIDLFTGNLKAEVVATNKSLQAGHVYKTQGDVVVSDECIGTITTIMSTAAKVYADRNRDSAKYFFGSFAIDSLDDIKYFFGEKDYNGDSSKDSADAKAFIGNSTVTPLNKDGNAAPQGAFYDVAGDNKYYADLISGITYRYVNHDDNYTVIKACDELTYAKFMDMVDGVEVFDYTVYYVYDVNTSKIVCYVSEYVKDNKIEDTAADVVLSDAVTVAEYVDRDANIDAKITAQVGYKTVMNEQGKLVKIIVDGFKFTLTGLSVDAATHANIDTLNWHFGFEGDCDKETYLVKLFSRGLDLETVLSSMDVELFDHEAGCACEADAESACKLVKSIYVPVNKIGSKEGKEGKEVREAVEITADTDFKVAFDETYTNGDGGVYDGNKVFEFTVKYDATKMNATIVDVKPTDLFIKVIGD